MVLGPLQFAVCRHLIKRIEMGFNQSRQFIYFVSSEYMLQHFANDSCVHLQAFPAKVRPTFVSQQRVNQGMAMYNEEKGLRCIDIQVLLVRLFAFSLRIDLWYRFPTRQASIDFCDVVAFRLDHASLIANPLLGLNRISSA